MPYFDEQTDALEKGYPIFDLDGLKAKSMPDLFHEMSSIFRFPAYFGQNWEALSDCLKDLGWLADSKGYILNISSNQSLLADLPQDRKIFFDILEDVSHYWAGEEKRFITILGE